MSPRTLLVFSLSLLSCLLLLVGGLLYARFVEPRWVQQTHWEVQAEHWQGRPLRFVVLTDLHAKASDGEYIDRIVKQTLAAKPDAVFLLGDYINERRLGDFMEPETLGKHLAPLAQLPCFAVLGNHDYAFDANRLRTMLEGFGARLLDGRVHALEIGGGTLNLAGMRCLCTHNTPGEMEALPEGESQTCLLLTHSPAAVHLAPEGVTAMFAGHTHGGQVCLPGGQPLLKPDKRVRWEEMKGEVVTAGLPMYVSRGLGTSEMPLRFWCRPELLVVELKGPTAR